MTAQSLNKASRALPIAILSTTWWKEGATWKKWSSRAPFVGTSKTESCCTTKKQSSSSSDWQDHPVTNFTACQESLYDGISDQWKTLTGLSTTDPNLYKTVAANRYTYLEKYLNGVDNN